MSTIVAIFVIVAVASVLMTIIQLAVARIGANRPITYIGSTYTESRTNDAAAGTYDLADDAV